MQFTDVGGGVIDSDYRDPVAVTFVNFSNRVFEINKGCKFAVFEINKGCKFAQIIFQKIPTPTLREVLIFNDRTQRDQDSFGSSGLK